MLYARTSGIDMGMQTFALVIGSERGVQAGEFKQANGGVQAGDQASSSRRTVEFKQANRRVQAGEQMSSSRRASEFKQASGRVQAGEQGSVGA